MSKVSKKIQPLRSKTFAEKISEKKALELQNVRILQKNLVYVVGLSSSIAKPEILERKEYFGQYGRIIRIVINNYKSYSSGGKSYLSYSAYITYSSSREAATAILAVDSTVIDEMQIKASFGSTKYCSHFLKNIECFNKSCMFYHYIVDEKDIISKEENTVSVSRIDLAIKLADLSNPEIKEKLNDKNYQIKCNVLPLANTIFQRGYIINNENQIKCEIPTDIPSKAKFSLKSLLNKSKKPSIGDIKSTNSLKEIIAEESLNDILHINEREGSTVSTRNSLATTTVSEEFCTENRRYSDLSENLVKFNRKSFRPREKSRFNFTVQSTEADVNIPEGITEIISKRLATRYLLRNIDIKISHNKLLNILDQDWQDFITLNSTEEMRKEE